MSFEPIFIKEEERKLIEEFDKAKNNTAIKLIFEKEWEEKLVRAFSKAKNTSTLVILVDDENKNDGTDIYVRNKERFAKKLPNVKVETFHIKGCSTEKDLLKIRKLLIDKIKAGAKVMLQKPCGIRVEKLFIKIINEYPNADVEGLSNKNKAELEKTSSVDLKECSKHFVLPCTVYGDLILLQSAIKKLKWNTLKGKTVLLVGRSEIVGKPLERVFEKEDCTLILTNSNTSDDDLQEYARKSDVIISSVGKPNLIKRCKQGAILIDNGCSLVNGKQHGDVAKKLYEKSSSYTPYTNATGKCTVFSLFVNLYIMTNII